MKKIIALIAIGVTLSLQAATYNIAAGDVADLEAKMLAAVNNDEIVLAKGTYNLTHTISNTASKAVTLRGATGNRDDVILNGQGVLRCLWLSGNMPYGSDRKSPADLSKAVKVYDLTISNGFNNAVADCQSTVGGGGAYVYYGVVTNCCFKNCSADSPSEKSNARGGGLFASCVLIKDCLFENCHAMANGGVRGGALGCVVGGSNLSYRMSDTVFKNCYAKSYGNKGNGYMASGGGAYCTAICLTNVVFDGCWATNTVGYNSDYSNDGGGLYLASGNDSVFDLNNCCFTNCFAYGGGGAVWVNNNKPLTATKTSFVACGGIKCAAVYGTGSLTLDTCLFVTNFCTSTDGQGVIACLYDAKVNNCAFIDNVSYGKAGVIWFGHGNPGSISSKYVTEIKDTVFDGNASLTTANAADIAGVLSLGNFEADIERCIFVANKMKAYPDNYYNRGGTAIYLQKSATNVVVRNCYFTANSGSPTVMSCQGTQRFPATTSYLFENCTFADNSVTAYKETGCRNLVASKSSASWAYFNFRNNCFLSNTGIIDGLFNTSFVENYGGQITYNAADTTSGFPAEVNNNLLVSKIKGGRNKGHNETWMADALDCGDGTYTLTKSGDYGVRVAFNNVNKRIIGDIVDIGAQEMKIPGIVVIFR